MSSGYNIKDAASELCIKEEKLRIHISNFFSSAEDEFLKGLGAAIDGKDYALIHSEAHKMKGIASTLRFEGMTKILSEISVNSEKENPVDYPGLFSRLKEEFFSLKSELME